MMILSVLKKVSNQISLKLVKDPLILVVIRLVNQDCCWLTMICAD